MRKSIKVGVASAGLLLIGSPAAAFAETAGGPVNATETGNLANQIVLENRGGDDRMANDSTIMNSILNPGIVSGNQIDAMIQIPINVCGNAIGILGFAVASCQDSHATASKFGDEVNDHGDGPRQSSTQSPLRDRIMPKAKPVKKAEVGLLGNLLSPLTGLLGSGQDDDLQRGYWKDRGDDAVCNDTTGMNSIGNIGIVSGNQIDVDAQIPVNISGNAIGVLGAAIASAQDTSATADFC